jgi:hypothetical protein
MSTSPTHRPAAGSNPGTTRAAIWGTSPTPPGPKLKRSGRILLAAAIGLILLVATGCAASASPTDNGPAPSSGTELRSILSRCVS